MYNLEEFPPQRERPVIQEPRSRIGSFAVPGAAWIVVTGVLLVGTWLWSGRRTAHLQAELEQAVSSLESARGAISLLWTTVTRLDSAQEARQVVLRDTVGYVRDYLEIELARLWESAYHDHRRRLEQHAAKLFDIDDSIERMNRSLRSVDGSVSRVLAAVQRTDARVTELSRQSELYAADLRSTGDVVAGVRETVNRMTGQLGELQGQFTLARGEQEQLDGRVDGVESWVSGFRSEGLNARAVQGRFASLVEVLRNMTERVDSLESVLDSVRSVRTTLRSSQ